MASVTQEGALCGVHALNALLQGPYFTAVDLSQVAWPATSRILTAIPR